MRAKNAKIPSDSTQIKSKKLSQSVELYKLHTEGEAAKFCGTTSRTMQHWRQKGDGPTYIKIGRSVRYRLCDLIAFAEKRIRHEKSEVNDVHR